MQRKATILADGNSAALLKDFPLDPKKFLEKPLTFNLKKTSGDQIIDKIIDGLPKDNDEYYVDHKKGTDVFALRKYYSQSKNRTSTQLY